MSALPRFDLTVILVPAVVVLGAGVVAANPDGGQVIRGDATISKSGKVVEINQTSKKAAIDWQSFSIGVDESVRFNQPSKKALTLNRVTGGDVSSIDGSLLANGRIILSNPNGIRIGRTAKVDVASLIATSARLADSDLDTAFNDDIFRFTDAPPGSFVINEGEITVAGRGLAALVAPWVANENRINAFVGEVILASGSAFTVDLYGDGLLKLAVDAQMAGALGTPPDGLSARVSNSGTISAEAGIVTLEVSAASQIVDQLINMDGIIEARSGSQASTGTIVLRGLGDGEISVAGTLDATGMPDEPDQDLLWRGGEIYVLGEDIRVSESALFDVSADGLAGAITFAGGIGTDGGFLPVGKLDLPEETQSILKLDNIGSGESFEPVIVKADEPSSEQLAGAVVTALQPTEAFTYGIRDKSDPNNQVDLLPPDTLPGESAGYQVTSDGAVFVDGIRKGSFQNSDYEIFVRSADGELVDFSSDPTAGLTFAIADGALHRLDNRLQPPLSSRQSWNPTTNSQGRNRGRGDDKVGPPSCIGADCCVGSTCNPTTDTPPETEEQCSSWRQDASGSDAAVTRCYAALAMDAIAVHAGTSFAALASALEDPSPLVRARAVRELGEIGAYLSAAVPVLVQAMANDDGRVARLAEGVIRDADGFAQAVVPALTNATLDVDDRVVRNAAVALGDLGAYGTPALPVLDDTLDHDDITVRFNAAQGITKVDAGMRETILALSQVAAGGETVNQLEGALDADRSPFRARAVGTLAAVSDDTQEVSAAVLPALGAVDAGERASAVRTLGELDRIAGAALPVLIQAVSLPQSQALRASLAGQGSTLPLDAGVVRPLLQALNDRDPEVRAAAASALESLAATASRASRDLAELPREDLIVRRLAGRAEMTFAGFAPAVLPALQPAVADEDPRVRDAAVTAIGHLGPAADPAVPLLVASLAGPESETQRSAAQALGRIGTTPEDAVPALADRLFDPDPRVACEAGRALGLFGDAARPVSSKLLAAAEADESGPGFCAGVALFAVDPPAAREFWPPELAELGKQIEVEALLESVKGPAPFPRQANLPVGPDAVAALPALAKALAAAPEADQPAFAELLTLVAEEVRNQVPWLTQELAQGDPASKGTAIRLLANLTAASNEALRDLVAGLDHPSTTVRFAMVRTLSLIAAQTTAATQALLAVALDDESDAVRADATDSLRQLAALQTTTGRGPALVAEAPIGRAGQSLVRLDPQFFR